MRQTAWDDREPHPLGSFGSQSAGERRDENRILDVESDIFAATVAGRRLSDVFGDIIDAYPRHGFATDSWTEHHQGGPTGYVGRDPRASRMTAKDCLTVNQAVAWNPSAPYTKIEDTVLLTEVGIEVLTVDERWPTLDVDGRLRPVTLEL